VACLPTAHRQCAWWTPSPRCLAPPEANRPAAEGVGSGLGRPFPGAGVGTSGVLCWRVPTVPKAHRAAV
jgi:hypothetical protein